MSLRQGDILMLHSGWREWFLGLPPEGKQRMRACAPFQPLPRLGPERPRLMHQQLLAKLGMPLGEL